jgi:hypothetical protein
VRLELKFYAICIGMLSRWYQASGEEGPAIPAPRVAAAKAAAKKAAPKPKGKKGKGKGKADELASPTRTGTAEHCQVFRRRFGDSYSYETRGAVPKLRLAAATYGVAASSAP